MNGHIYEYVAGTTTWSNAFNASALKTYEDEPGYLVTITNQVEQDYVNSNVSGANLWIGLTDAANEGTFKWASGPEAGTTIRENGVNVSGQYNNWASSQPDNANGQEHYVGVKFNGGTQWNDFTDNFNGISGYLVEYGTWSDAMDLNFYSSQATEVIFTQIPQGITISPDNTTTSDTSEDGTQSIFNVVLDINPTEDVTIPINSSDTTEGVSSVDELTFTKENWDVPQTFTVSGVDDELFDGDVTYMIETGSPVSG